MSNKHYIIPIFVPHQGCPHDCVFCNQNSITGSSEKVNAEYVRKTVEAYLNTISKNKIDNTVVEVSFFGGTFTAIELEKQKELLQVAYEYKESGKIDYIRLSTRPDYIDNHILNNLKRYSVDIIELGVQSLDDEVLFKSGRGHTVQDVVNASNLIKSYGFTLGHQIMLGLPGDDFKKDIDTVLRVVSLKPNICRIYPALVVKNTPMEKMYANGEYKPYTLEQAVEVSKILYGVLYNNNIKIIRIGLQPTEEINKNSEVVAGPFHPAFRELVEGSLYNDMLFEELGKNNFTQVTVYINNRDISKLYACRKKFFNDNINQLETVNIKIVQDSAIQRKKMFLKSDKYSKELSIDKYLIKRYEKDI
jgi:histone acetyltransferase (RNA polymerase elongator complex component)